LDRATSEHPRVQALIDRLALLSPGWDSLGLSRITRLLARLGDPQHRLPPVFHVAGTNGKGSTCAFLRAGIEAAGFRAHVYTSPHLVRFNERIRLGGRLIGDDALADLLAEVLDAAGKDEISFFEATTAAGFLAFSREPADACIVEVGLGGRLDATNVIAAPLICGIADLGHDHKAFLGSSLPGIATEKAGIAKERVPLVTQKYRSALALAVSDAAGKAGAIWLPRGEAWDSEVQNGRLRYRDAKGQLDLPLPSLPGAHQAKNAALAIAMLRHQDRLEIGAPALATAIAGARWPARLQRLPSGPLLDLLPPDSELWIDGAHNPAAATTIADYFSRMLEPERALHLVVGLLANRPAGAILRPFKSLGVRLHSVAVPGHESHDPARLAAVARRLGMEAQDFLDLRSALSSIRAGVASPPSVLIFGSLYLAGQALALNGSAPD